MSPADAQALASVPWWVWPVALFGVCFLLGIVAVPAGIGGGVLFVPIVSGFFPFHLDFVRGAGTLVALSGALSAAPRLLGSGLANLRLGLPLGITSSAGSIAGAMYGMVLEPRVLETALGLTILAIVAIMALVPRRTEGDDGSAWVPRHRALGMVLFAGIGFVAGLFGLGAGWANVPVLNLLMAVPIKVASGTSGLIITFAPAAWVYLHQGAVLAIIAVPSIAGMTLGARIGVRLLDVLRPESVRRLVLALLVFAGARMLLKGFGIWT
jgi:uncharacterized protein